MRSEEESGGAAVCTPKRGRASLPLSGLSLLRVAALDPRCRNEKEEKLAERQDRKTQGQEHEKEEGEEARHESNSHSRSSRRTIRWV